MCDQEEALRASYCMDLIKLRETEKKVTTLENALIKERAIRNLLFSHMTGTQQHDFGNEWDAWDKQSQDDMLDDAQDELELEDIL